MSELTIEKVIERISRIAGMSEDPEIAHSEEDDLYFDVLWAIAKDKTHAQELAKLALTTKDIEFPRWCA